MKRWLRENLSWGRRYVFSDPKHAENFWEAVYLRWYTFKYSTEKFPRLAPLVGSPRDSALARYMFGLRDQFARFRNVEVPFGLGIAEEGSLIARDFTEIRYLLVSGMQGTGKTRSSYLLFLTMLLFNHANALDLHILDIKGEDLTDFKGLVNYLSDPEAVVQRLRELHERSKHIRAEFTKYGMSNLIEYNNFALKKGLPLFKYQVILVEEFAILFSMFPEAGELTRFLVSFGRSSGTYMILSMQRPDITALEGSIKANMSAVVSFRQFDDISARVAGIDQAFQLEKQGEAFFKEGAKLTKFQVPTFSRNQGKYVLARLRESSSFKKKGS